MKLKSLIILIQTFVIWLFSLICATLFGVVAGAIGMEMINSKYEKKTGTVAYRRPEPRATSD